MSDFETFVNTELPRRSAHLTKSITGYDGNPNNVAAPDIVKNSPLGTWFREETNGKWWRKTETIWVEITGGGSTKEIRTTEDFTVTVDYTTGVSPPAGTVVSSQADFDALGAPLKYPQEAIEIMPPFVDHTVDVSLLAGEQYARDNQGWAGLGCTLDISNIPTPQVTGRGSYNTYESPLPPIGLRFRGATADIETGIAGTLNTSTYPNTFVRSSGSWVAEALAGKRVLVTSGASSGYKVIIIDNTADTLYLAVCLTTGGVATISTYELASHLVPELADGTPVYWVLGSTVGGRSKYLQMLDLSLGTEAKAQFGSLLSDSVQLYDCDSFGGFEIVGPCQGSVRMSNCLMDNGIAFKDGVPIYSLNSMLFRGDRNPALLYLSNASYDGFYSALFFAPTSGATYPAVRLQAARAKLYAHKPLVFIGQGAEDAIHLDDDSELSVINKGIQANDCATVIEATLNSSIYLDAFSGSGNDLIFDVVTGARARYSGTPTGTQFAEIDGTVYDQPTYFANSGDEVEGSEGSSVRRVS